MKVSVTTDEGEVVEIYSIPEIQPGQPDARTRALREAAERSEVGVTEWEPEDGDEQDAGIWGEDVEGNPTWTTTNRLASAPDKPGYRAWWVTKSGGKVTYKYRPESKRK